MVEQFGTSGVPIPCRTNPTLIKYVWTFLFSFYVWTNFHDIIIQTATPIVNVWHRNCNFFMNRGGSTFCCRPLDYHTAETGELVNGGRSPFISTVDMGARLCYVITKQGDQLFTVDRLWLSYSVDCFLKPILLLLRSFDHYKVQLPWLPVFWWRIWKYP